MKYDFDKMIPRRGSASIKWDLAENIYGEPDILPLWVADMDFPVPSEVHEAVMKRAAHGIYGYTALLPSCGEAVSSWLKDRHDWDVLPEWLVFTPGVVPSINMIIQQFTEPGEGVIIQEPVYYPFRNAVTKNDRITVNNPLRLEKGLYRMDLDDFHEKAVKDNVRMLILCSPHNPVGRVWERDELENLAAICNSLNILVVSDEIHSDLVFRGRKHIPYASLSERCAGSSIVCNAPSKTFNIPGLQISYAVIADEGLRKQFKRRLARNGIFLPNTFGPIALEAAYRYGGDWLNQVMSYIEENYQYLADFIRTRLPRVTIIEPQGTYLVWMDFRGFRLSTDELRDILRHRSRVALEEGDIFGEDGNGFVRINIACSRSLLEEALDRIAETFENL